MKGAVMRVLVLLALPGLVSAQGVLVEKTQAKADPQVAAWVDTLIQRIADRNETIRSSVHRALAAVGRPALPALRKVADGGEAAAAEAARAVIARIAQPAWRGEDRRDRRSRRGFGRIGRTLDGIELTAEQKAGVEELQEAQRKESEELRERVRNGEITRVEIRAAIRQMRVEMSRKLREILTEEQYRKYRENLTRRFRRRGRGGG